MTTITLDVPDELARRLNRIREALPQLLVRLLNLEPEPTPELALDAPHPAFTEMIDLLARGPTPEEIMERSNPCSIPGRRHGMSIS